MGAGRRAPAGGPRQESVAGRWMETRITPVGSQLTRAQFLYRYGDCTKWNRARGTGCWAETRIAPDGSMLTLRQFLRRYGSYENWNRARRQRKTVMRLEQQVPPSDYCTPPRGRTAGPKGGLRSPEAGGAAGGGLASPWMASALSQHSGPAAGCALDAVHPPPLRPAPLIRQEHAHSQGADALAALAAAEAALRRERAAREESESALSRERSEWQHSAAVHKTVEDALQRGLGQERRQRLDYAAALAVAEETLRSEQAARRELQEKHSREKELRRSTTEVETTLIRDQHKLLCELEEARSALQASAARAGELRQLLLGAEERAQAAQQRERDERNRASRLLFQAAQRAAERIERERTAACCGSPSADAAVGDGDGVTLGSQCVSCSLLEQRSSSSNGASSRSTATECDSGAGAETLRDADSHSRGPEHHRSGCTGAGHVLTRQEREEIRRTEGRLLTSEVVVNSVALYSPGRWFMVCRATACSVVPILGCWQVGYRAGVDHLNRQFLREEGIVASARQEVADITYSVPAPDLQDGYDLRFAASFLFHRGKELYHLYKGLHEALREIQEIMREHAFESERAMKAVSLIMDMK